jgi:hypothetical protein
MNGCCEYRGIPRIRLCVDTKLAMLLLRNASGQGEQQPKRERAESLHAD